MYQIIRSGDEAGLYFNQTLLIGWWWLWKHGIEIYRLMHWSQKALARLAEESKKW